MISEKKWLKLWIIIALCIPILALFNYIIDPYGINDRIHVKHMNIFKKSNTGYTYRFKTKRLIEDEFDTIMLGTSRIGVMDPKVVDKYIRGHTFNFEAPGSIVEMQYKLFKYALKYNNVKNLVYGIDFMAFNRNRTLKNTFPQFNKLDKAITAGEEITNYDLYFNLNTTMSSFYVLYRNMMNQTIITDKYLSNGRRVFYPYLDRLKKGTYSYDRRLKFTFYEYYNEINGIYKNYEYSEKDMNYFLKIIDECKTKNIKVWVYIPPMYNKQFDSIKEAGYFDEFEKFERELAKITNYIDFTGHNSVTNNSDNFLDGSHLRVEMTRLIMARIFDDKSVDVPSDLGELVTQENIETHLKNLSEFKTLKHLHTPNKQIPYVTAKNLKEN